MITWLKTLFGGPGTSNPVRSQLRVEEMEPRLTPADVASTLGGALSLGTAGRVAIVRSESVGSPADIDMYKFTVSAGQRIGFDIDTPSNGPPGLGSYLRLFDASGRELAANNDQLAPGDAPPAPGSGSDGFDSYIEYRFTRSGTYYIGVSNWQNRSYNPNSGASNLGSNSNWLTGEYQLIVATARNETGAARFWTISSGVDTYPFHDYHVEFYIPKTAKNWTVYGLSTSAQATLDYNKRHSAGYDDKNFTADGKFRIIHLTAGLMARSAGSYYSYSAAGWASNLRVAYEP